MWVLKKNAMYFIVTCGGENYDESWVLEPTIKVFHGLQCPFGWCGIKWNLHKAQIEILDFVKVPYTKGADRAAEIDNIQLAI